MSEEKQGTVSPPQAGANAGPQIEIRWGGKDYRFESKAAALKAGFHLDDSGGEKVSA